MHGEIEDFSWQPAWPPKQCSISWSHKGVRVTKEYGAPIQTAVLLNDISGVALVESPFASGSTEPNRRNAVIINADGSERNRVALPIPEAEVGWFGQMYYVNTELTAILMIPGHDIAVVVDEHTGGVVRSYETR